MGISVTGAVMVTILPGHSCRFIFFAVRYKGCILPLYQFGGNAFTLFPLSIYCLLISPFPESMQQIGASILISRRKYLQKFPFNDSAHFTYFI